MGEAALLATAWSMFGMGLTAAMVITGAWSILPMIVGAFFLSFIASARNR